MICMPGGPIKSHETLSQPMSLLSRPPTTTSLVLPYPPPPPPAQDKKTPTSKSIGPPLQLHSSGKSAEHEGEEEPGERKREMASSTACFLHTYVPSPTSTTPSHRLSPVVVRPATLSCRAQKQQQANDVVEDAAVSRRLALTVLVGGVATVGVKVSPADAAYGEAANVFGKPKTNTDFMEYAGDGFRLLVPAKWNTSKEVEYPGQVMRYEDNFDSLCNISVSVFDCNKKSITDYGTPEEFIGQFDYLLGKQSYSGKTESEGGFDPSTVAAANILETTTPVVGGTQYYNITVLTRTADGNEGGRHQIINAAVKGNKLYICKAQAGDKRWFKGARKFVESSANSFNVA